MSNQVEIFNDTAFNSLTLEESGVYFKILCIARQKGGKLWQKQGEGILTLYNLARLLGIEEKRCSEILSALVAFGCLNVDADGVYYNECQYADALRHEAFSKGGRTGGKKSRPSEHTLKNLKQYKTPEATPEAPFRSNRKPYRKPPSDITGSPLPVIPEATLPGMLPGLEPLTIGNNNIYNNNNNDKYISHETMKTETKTDPKKVTDPGNVIEPPPGMPRNEDEAVEMARPAGVPEKFVRDYAYPLAVASGWTMLNGNPIRSFPSWLKYYYNNRTNEQKRKESRQIQRNQPQYSSYMYRPEDNIQIPEL